VDRHWKTKTLFILMVSNLTISRMQCLAFRSRQSKLRMSKLSTKGAHRWIVTHQSGPRAPTWAKSFNLNQCKEARATSSKAKASKAKRRTNMAMSRISFWKIIIRPIILQKGRAMKIVTWKWKLQITFIQCHQIINWLMK